MPRIGVAGNIIVDRIKFVSQYPNKGMLADIVWEKMNVGGCVPNVSCDLRAIDNTLVVDAIGRIGADEEGRFVLEKLKGAGISTDKIIIGTDDRTSYTDVITEINGDRTFFHMRGANANFSPIDIDLDSLEYDHLHFGYLLLLDRFDQFDDEYGTILARTLADVHKRGITTSIDVVSVQNGKYKESVIPVLKYCDYLIVNEVEAGYITGNKPRDTNGNLIVDNIKTMLRDLIALGVNKAAFIHCPEAGFCLEKTGKLTVVHSILLKDDEIVGAVGAGDAFCSGVLYGLINKYDSKKTMEIASACAALCLRSEDSTSGMATLDVVQEYAQRPRRISI